MSDNTRIIEINGMKIEVDLRTAKRVDTFRVGDPVKVLKKKNQYGQAKLMAGVIVGFAEFQSMPSIEVLVMDVEYSGTNLKFITITPEIEDYEMIHYGDYEQLFTSSNVLDKMDAEIGKKEIELDELKRKRTYFIDEFEPAFTRIRTKE